MPDLEAIGQRIRRVIDGNGETHIQKKKHRTKFMIVSGTLLLIVMFMLALCVGPTSVINPVDAISSLFSGMFKNPESMTDMEVAVCSSRAPRALAAICVGISPRPPERLYSMSAAKISGISSSFRS